MLPTDPDTWMCSGCGCTAEDLEERELQKEQCEGCQRPLCSECKEEDTLHGLCISCEVLRRRARYGRKTMF
jgi:hypothetical protein